MRADIHDGPEHMLLSETEYIDARPNRTPQEDIDLLGKPARGKKCGAIEGILDE
jgi:hypothetical protein